MALIGDAVPWVFVAAGVGLLVAAELTVRAFAPRVAPLLEWRDWECQHKAEAIEGLGRRGGASVVAVGSSTMNAAFDAQQSTDILRLDRPAFNAALNAATFRTLELWLLGFVIPKLQPDLIVLGLDSFQFSDNNLVGERGFKMFRSSMAWRHRRADASAFQRLLRWAEEHSFLVRYRHFFREPGRWGMKPPPFTTRVRRFVKEFRGSFARDRGKRAAVSPLGMLEALSLFGRTPYETVRTDRMREAWVRFVKDYRIGSSELDALGRIVDAIRAADVALLLVLMPATQDWVDFHPRGAQDFDAFKVAVAGFVAERDAPFLDARSGFTSLDEYADALHCNPVGRERFTGILSATVADLLGPVAR